MLNVKLFVHHVTSRLKRLRHCAVPKAMDVFIVIYVNFILIRNPEGKKQEN